MRCQQRLGVGAPIVMLLSCCCRATAELRVALPHWQWGSLLHSTLYSQQTSQRFVAHGTGSISSISMISLVRSAAGIIYD